MQTFNPYLCKQSLLMEVAPTQVNKDSDPIWIAVHFAHLVITHSPLPLPLFLVLGIQLHKQVSYSSEMQKCWRKMQEHLDTAAAIRKAAEAGTDCKRTSWGIGKSSKTPACSSRSKSRGSCFKCTQYGRAAMAVRTDAVVQILLHLLQTPAFRHKSSLSIQLPWSFWGRNHSRAWQVS